MVSDILEQRIYELVRSHDGIYLFKKKELTPSTDLDSDLQLEDDEVLALMDDFFTTFNVDKGNFSITTYYPPEPPLKHLLAFRPPSLLSRLYALTSYRALRSIKIYIER